MAYAVNDTPGVPAGTGVDELVPPGVDVVPPGVEGVPPGVYVGLPLGLLVGVEELCGPALDVGDGVGCPDKPIGPS